MCAVSISRNADRSFRAGIFWSQTSSSSTSRCDSRAPRLPLPPTSPIRVTGKGLRADQPIAEESGRRPQHKRHEVPLAQSNYTRLQSKSRDPVVMCRCFKQISNDAMALFADFFQHATSERATLKRDEKRQIQLVATLGNAVKMNPLMAKSMLSLAISKLSSTN